MSSRAVISVVLILVSLGASAADWGTLAADSDRTLDPALLSAMQDEDLDTKLSICAGVGNRADPFAGNIIAALMAGNSRKTRDTVELLLRTLLQGLFEPSRGESWISQRIEANRNELDSMAGEMAEWRDPQLVGALVRILPLLNTPRALPALAQAGSRVVRALERGSGAIHPQELALVLDFLSAVERTHRSDFLAQCTDIARLSREKLIVDRARAVAREIAAPNSRNTMP
jgi:hypothetical protein